MSAISLVAHQGFRNLVSDLNAGRVSFDAASGHAPNSNASSDSPPTMLPQLQSIYTMMDDTFRALDFAGEGAIEAKVHGTVICNLLTDMQLLHLWEPTRQALDDHPFLTIEQFREVFLAWVGVTPQFEEQLRAGADS